MMLMLVSVVMLSLLLSTYLNHRHSMPPTCHRLLTVSENDFVTYG